MIKGFILGVVCSFLLFLVGTVLVFATVDQVGETALETVRKVYDRLKDYTNTDPDSSTKKKEINSYWLLEDISLDAIRDHWERMNKTQRNRYLILMRNLLEKIIYEDTKNKLQKGITRIIREETLYSDKSLVKTVLTIKKNNLTVSNDYLMVKIGNQWKIREIYIDGQNLAEDYRSQYNQIIEKYGIQGTSRSLLERIEYSTTQPSDWYRFSDENQQNQNSHQHFAESPIKKTVRQRPTLIS